MDRGDFLGTFPQARRIFGWIDDVDLDDLVSGGWGTKFVALRYVSIGSISQFLDLCVY